MGFHDRSEDESYSRKLRMKATPHQYVRDTALASPIFAETLAQFGGGPVKPHKRYRRLCITSNTPLPVGETVICVRNGRPDWAPTTLVLVTQDCRFVAPVAAKDAEDLAEDLLKHGSIAGTIKSKTLQGQADVLLEMKE